MLAVALCAGGLGSGELVAGALHVSQTVLLASANKCVSLPILSAEAPPMSACSGTQQEQCCSAYQVVQMPLSLQSVSFSLQQSSAFLCGCSAKLCAALAAARGTHLEGSRVLFLPDERHWLCSTFCVRQSSCLFPAMVLLRQDQPYCQQCVRKPLVSPPDAALVAGRGTGQPALGLARRCTAVLCCCSALQAVLGRDSSCVSTGSAVGQKAGGCQTASPAEPCAAR